MMLLMTTISKPHPAGQTLNSPGIIGPKKGIPPACAASGNAKAPAVKKSARRNMRERMLLSYRAQLRPRRLFPHPTICYRENTAVAAPCTVSRAYSLVVKFPSPKRKSQVRVLVGPPRFLRSETTIKIQAGLRNRKPLRFRLKHYSGDNLVMSAA